MVFKSISTDNALFLTGSAEYYYPSILVRSIMYPLTSFSLTLIPISPFMMFARHITNILYPFITPEQFILTTQSIVLDMLSLLASAILLLSLFIASFKENREAKNKIVFWILFILLSFLPYIIISKNFAYLESRYYYLASIGWSMILTFALSKLQKGNRTIFLALISIFLIFVFWHARIVKKDISSLVEISNTRIGLIDQIKISVPNLEKNKNIFVITSDTDYYAIGNKVPFQSGTGYILMTLYYESGKIPNKLLDEAFLFEIGSVGYKEVGNLGFGYFTDSDAANEVAKENDQIKLIQLKYDYETNTLRSLNP